MNQTYDVIVVGAGLAGIVAATEAAARGRRVLLLDQEGHRNLGGQAYWSFGGLFLVDSPEQRRLGIHDSADLAWSDWLGSAQFDREVDDLPRQWARAYVDFAAGEKRAWLHAMGLRIFPVVGWAERGDGRAGGHGNSVPRFHITWGTGPGVLEPFVRRLREGIDDGRITVGFRHRVDELLTRDGAVTGVRGSVLARDDSPRGVASSREVTGAFEVSGAVVIASGGIGGDVAKVRAAWPAERLGPPPRRMVAGVPAHVDGRMLEATARAGGAVVNADRMWHYSEGLRNWDPVWANHGIRILPGPSSLWLDATGERLPPPAMPGFDTLGTLRTILATGHDYSWFVLTQRIIEKEFALSGSEQNPDLTGRDLRRLADRLGSGAPGPVQAFVENGEEFVVAESLEDLIAGMARVGDPGVLDGDRVRHAVALRDAQLANEVGKDAQLTFVRGHRGYVGDRVIRVAEPHRLTDPQAGPMIAVRLNILTRKTLGGLHTDLQGRVLGADGAAIDGLYAAGEVAGFGGGGMHGYNALEGTFLGGCLFSGRVVGRAV